MITCSQNNIPMKMLKGQVENEVTRSNLQKMLDVELIIDFHCIFPLLELTHTLFKYA
jgi:hypothetical protein